MTMFIFTQVSRSKNFVSARNGKSLTIFKAQMATSPHLVSLADTYEDL